MEATVGGLFRRMSIDIWTHIGGKLEDDLFF